MTTVRVIRVDPYHKVYGVLVHELAQRISASTQKLGDEADIVCPQFFSALWAKSPYVLLLAAVDSVGYIKGFAAAQLKNETEVIILQPKMDEPTENDAIQEMMDEIENWARSMSLKRLTLISSRADPKWFKKFDFEVKQYILVKELT